MDQRYLEEAIQAIEHVLEDMRRHRESLDDISLEGFPQSKILDTYISRLDDIFEELYTHSEDYDWDDDDEEVEDDGE